MKQRTRTKPPPEDAGHSAPADCTLFRSCGRILRLTAALVAVAALLIFVWSLLVEPKLLVVRRHEIAPPGWPETLDGYKIMLISDIHDFPHPRSPGKLRRISEIAAANRPDLILLLGDYVYDMPKTTDNPEYPELTGFISTLKAEDGVYAVLGNHELWHGRMRVSDALTAGGATMLENQMTTIRHGDGKFQLAGLPDCQTGPAPALKKISASSNPYEPLLLVAHDPNAIISSPPEATLMFSGHTHGGQLRFPGIGSLKHLFLDRWTTEPAQNLAFNLHLNSYRGKLVYVSSGLGGDRLRARLFCPPEVNIVTLHAPGTAIQPLPAHEAWFPGNSGG